MIVEQLQQFIAWLYSPEIIANDTLGNVILRVIIVMVLFRSIVAKLVKYNLYNEIKMLPDYLVEEIIYGDTFTAVVIMTMSVVSEEILYFGIPYYIAQRFFYDHIYNIMLLSGIIWSIAHIYPKKIILLLPEGILRSMLWLSGYWYISVIQHIINNIVALLILKKQI